MKDKQLQLWDVRAGQKRTDFPGQWIGTAVFSGDAWYLAYSTDDYAVHLWDVQAGAEACVLRRPFAARGGAGLQPGREALRLRHGYPAFRALGPVQAGEEVAVLRGHRNTVRTVALESGREAAHLVLARTKRRHLWDAGRAGTWSPYSRGAPTWSGTRPCSPDGKHLATASRDGTVRLWDAANGEPVAVLRGHTGVVLAAVFSPDDTLLASWGEDATVRLWDLEQLERSGVLRGHTSFVYDVAFRPDGRRAVSAAWDGTARLWDLDTGRETGRFQHATGEPYGIVTPPASARTAGRSPRSRVRAGWRFPGRRHGREGADPPRAWGRRRAGVSAGGLPAPRKLSGRGCGDGALRSWDAAGDEPVAVLRGREDLVLDVAFSPDGTQLASAGVEGTVPLLGPCRPDLPGRCCAAAKTWVFSLAYSPDGRLLAAACRDKTVRLWNSATHEVEAILPHDSLGHGVAFSPDGRRLAAGCTTTASACGTWTPPGVPAARNCWRRRWPSCAGANYVHAVAWSPDGTRLLSASGDHTVRIWDSLWARSGPRVRPGNAGEPS